MKKIILSAILTLLAAGASAQSYIVDNPGNRSYFGIRASGEITCPGKFDVQGNKIEALKKGGGFEVGAIYQVPVVANFYVEPGLSFYYNATGVKNASIGDLDLNVWEHNSFRKAGFRVPVMLGYHFDFTPQVNLAVFTGPELDVGLSNDWYFTSKESALGQIHHAPSLYGDNVGAEKMNRVGCNWKFGVGFNFLQNYYVGVSGAVGLCDMAKSDNVKFHENRVDITLGYNFK